MIRKLVSFLFPQDEPKLKCWLRLVSIIMFTLYVFSIPTFSARYPFNYLSIAICALMCILMFVYVSLYGKFQINLLILLLIAFNLTILISHLINWSFSSFPKTILLMSLVAFILYNFVSAVENKNFVVYAILISSIVFAFIYIIHYRSQLFNFLSDGFSRLGSDFDNENEIAKEIAMFCMLALSLTINTKRLIYKTLYLVAALLFLFLLLTTGSISNLLTVTVVAFVCIIIAQKTIKRRIIISAIVIAAIGAFFLVIQLPALSYFKTRIINIFTTLFNGGSTVDDGSAFSRLQGALQAFKVSMYKIFWGFGYMSAPEYTVANIQAHNNFVELLIDFGVFGFLIYQVIALRPVFSYKKSKWPFLVLPIALYMFIFQLFLTTYYKKFEYVLYPYLFVMIEDSLTKKYVIYDSSYLTRKKAKPTIFEIIPSLTPVGGAETFVADFVIGLKNKYSSKYNVIVILLFKQKESSLLTKLKESDIEVIELDKKPGFDYFCSLKLRELILEHNPRVIHTHLHSFVSLKTAKFFRRKDMTFVHTIHQNFSGMNNKEKILFHLIKTNYLTPICVSKEPAKNYGEVIKKEIQYIDNGVDISRYDSTTPLYKRKIDFLIVGRFVEVKNHKYLLEIIKQYFNNKKYSFVFLGDGPLLNECKEYVETMEFKAAVSFNGVVDNVNEYMSNSKVLLIPSKNEGNPIVVNEAFASGMAIVGNDVGGLHNMLSKVDIGGLAIPADSQSFAKLSLNTLETIRNEKIKSIDYSKKSFDISKTVDQYVKIFGVKYEKQ